MDTAVNGLIVEHLAGSKSYGTSVPTSDTDYRGIFCADKKHIWTPFFPIKEMKDESREDAKLFELRDYMEKYLKGNPNIIETLWVDEQFITESTDEYKMLREAAPELLSSKIAFTFSGYAFAQLKRMKGHNKWINNPQSTSAPKQSDFMKLVQNFEEEKIFAKDFDIKRYAAQHALIPYGNDIYGVLPDPRRAMFNRDGSIKKYDYSSLSDIMKKTPPKFIIKFCREEYLAAVGNHKNYWEWRRNRNQTRSKLEEQYGYDTKHAMHLVRLMRMGSEILDTGVVNVLRPDAEELISIRNGAWTYDEVMEFAKDKDAEMRKLYDTTELPKYPNVNKAADVLMNIQESIWSANHDV